MNPPRIGPPPDPNSLCTCNRAADAKCVSCGENFCQRHWWRHSHYNRRPLSVTDAAAQPGGDGTANAGLSTTTTTLTSGGPSC